MGSTQRQVQQQKLQQQQLKLVSRTTKATKSSETTTKNNGCCCRFIKLYCWMFVDLRHCCQRWMLLMLSRLLQCFKPYIHKIISATPAFEHWLMLTPQQRECPTAPPATAAAATRQREHYNSCGPLGWRFSIAFARAMCLSGCRGRW